MSDLTPYLKRLSALELERQSFESVWQDISDYIVPYRGRFEAKKENEGTRKGEKIYRDKAGLALRVFASGLMAGITSPAYPWFKFAPSKIGTELTSDMKGWFYTVESRMRDVFNASNLYRALPTYYTELGAFGTACMHVDQSFDSVIRCQVPTIGTFYCSNNDDYRVNTIYRKMAMTVAQLKEKEKDYGWNLSARVKALWDKDQTEEWIDIIHVIEPNDGREVGKIDGKNKLFRSVYFEKGNIDGEIMSSSGFDECPSMVCRWETIGEDVYGSEYPAILALGDVKELQFKVKTKAQGLALMVKPSFVGPPNVAGKKVNATPGGYTESSESESQGKIRPLFEVNLPLQALQLDIQETENIISKFFYEDMFLMLANTDRRQITAREVAERHEEKLLMLGPLLVRLHDELLSPLIDRTFGIMARGGLIPPAPKELQGQDLKVEFISLLAQAQKSVGASAIDEMTAYIGNVSQFDPNALNKLDVNQAIDARADMLGIPPKMIRNTKDSMAISQQKADMQAQAQQMQQMQQMATMAKDAGSASDTRLPEMIKSIVGNQ